LTAIASVRKGERFYSDFYYTIHDFSFTGISVGILSPALFDVQMTVDVADYSSYAEIFRGFLKVLILNNRQPCWRYALFLITKGLSYPWFVIRGCGARNASYCEVIDIPEG